MDPYDGVVLGNRFDPKWDPIRNGLGHTLRLAKGMNLASMVPRDELASSSYCLANPAKTGAEYLVYLPEGGKVTVDLAATSGRVEVAWLNPTDGTLRAAGVADGGASRQFTAPFGGDAVLRIKGS